LASKALIAVKTLQRIEKGNLCKPEHLEAVALALEVPLSDIVAPIIPALVNHVCSFDAFALDRARGFTGRQFLFSEITSFLSDPQSPSGYFAVIGDPGIGKSAIVSKLFEDDGKPIGRNLDCFFHFNITPEGITRSSDFIGNVCSQLIHAYGLPYTSLPEGFGANGAFFAKILREAAQKLTRGHRLVIIIDALDEAQQTNTGILTNPLYLPFALPDAVYLIVTSRRADHTLVHASTIRPFELASDDPRNMEDAAAFIRSWLASTGIRAWIGRQGITSEEFIETLVARSKGNFMYLHHVQRAVARPEPEIQNVSELPHGLRDYYRRHWEQMRRKAGADFDRIHRPVICALAAAFEPATSAQVATWAGLQLDQVHRVVRDWIAFLRPSKGDGNESTYSLYHTSFQEFLREEVDIDLKEHHAKIARSFLDKKRKARPAGGGRRP
jgi:hypothetical protein